MSEKCVNDLAEEIPDDFTTPKKKKKKDKDKTLEGSSSHKKHTKRSYSENIENTDNLSFIKGNNELDDQNININEHETSVTSSKKKKKKVVETQDEENISTNTYDDPNTSIMENGTTLTPSSKKKRKKENEDSRIADEAEVGTVKSSESAEHDSSKSARKKSKKRESIEGTEEKGEETEEKKNFDNNSEERNVSESKRAKKKYKLEQSEAVSPDEGLKNEINETENINPGVVYGPKEGNVEKNAKATLPEDLKKTEEAENHGEFTMINEVKQIRRTKVDRVLPEWLSNSTIVSMNLADGVAVSEMQCLRPFLKKLINQHNVKKFFPVQQAVIPELIANASSLSMRYRPRDICVSAPTGSGKTLAYVVPIIQALANRVVPQIRALILLPTQELARQVHDVISSYTRFTRLKLSLAVGGRSLKKEQATLLFEDIQGDYAADILVATPGKLNDHMNFTEKLNLNYLRYLVMDEADLFASASGGSFMVQVEKLLKRLPKPTTDNSVICGGFQTNDSVRMPEFYLQKILISATLMHDPEELKVFNLYRPKLFTVSNTTTTDVAKGLGPYIRPKELIEEYVYVESTQKPLILYHLIKQSKLSKVLVFTKSKESTHSLTIVLSALFTDLKVAEFSSNKSNRRQILEDFYKKKINVLVSSDATSRGIDIKNIQQVVSYDVPSVQTYVHRSGRTGRAGKVGYSLCMVEDTEDAKKDFKPILMSCKDCLSKIYVNERELIGYTEQYKQALEKLKETLQAEKEKKWMLRKRGIKVKKPKNNSKVKGKPRATVAQS